MATGYVILAWDSHAVGEFLTPGQSGLFVSPTDGDEAVETARKVLRDPGSYRPLGAAAAVQVRESYAHDVTLPALVAHFDRLREERR